MNVQEIIKKVKKIELKARRKTNNPFLGSYHSSFKGRGMTFSEIRPYYFGDDVRAMDWNKTAHFNQPFVKVFEEERELSMMLLLDISQSSYFAVEDQSKKQTMIEVAATLAFSAEKNNDKVGLLLFSDRIELYIPPKKGRKHVLRIIREMVERQPLGLKTDISMALDYLMHIQKQKQIVFLISDFIAENYAKSASIVAKKHNLNSIRIVDRIEQKLPNIGWVALADMESGVVKYVNTSDKKIEEQYRRYFSHQTAYFKNSFSQIGASTIEMDSQADYYKILLKFFQTHV